MDRNLSQRSTLMIIIRFMTDAMMEMMAMMIVVEINYFYNFLGVY